LKECCSLTGCKFPKHDFYYPKHEMTASKKNEQNKTKEDVYRLLDFTNARDILFWY